MLCFSSLLRLETMSGPSETLNKAQNGKKWDKFSFSHFIIYLVQDKGFKDYSYKTRATLTKMTCIQERFICNGLTCTELNHKIINKLNRKRYSSELNYNNRIQNLLSTLYVPNTVYVHLHNNLTLKGRHDYSHQTQSLRGSMTGQRSHNW